VRGGLVVVVVGVVGLNGTRRANRRSSDNTSGSGGLFKRDGKLNGARNDIFGMAQTLLQRERGGLGGRADWPNLTRTTTWPQNLSAEKKPDALSKRRTRTPDTSARRLIELRRN
jgi:hypothetical protein